MSGGLEPGVVIGARYRLLRLLGEGGMGWVWEATDISSDKSFALKLLKGTKEEDRRRFQREVRAAAAVRHPNVIAIHDLIELPDGTLVIVMDLLEGETLGALVRRDGPVTLRELSAVLLPVLSALEAAHAEGIIHRDLKPDNIFLCKTTPGAAVKVLDFGVAKLTASEGLAARTQALTGTGTMIGTPYYMAPEQVFAEEDLDARADIWSLGVLIYECLTGVRPTEGDTVAHVLKRIMVGNFEPMTAHCRELPDDVTSLVGRMLSAKREDRPRDLAEVREVLEPYAGEHFPSFSRTVALPTVDPHAATVATPEGAPRPSTSELLATAGQVPPISRGDTNRAVSLIPAATLRTRKRRGAVIAAVALALIGTGVVARSSYRADRGATGNPSSSSHVPTSEAALGVSASPSSAPVPATRLAVSVAAEPSVAPPEATDAGTATRARTAGRPATPNVGTPVVSKPSCQAGEVPSEGHCCPLGHAWQSGRCERPYATSF